MLIDLSNHKYGLLTVIERCEDYVSPKGKHLTQWLCKCDCGKTLKITGSNLKRSRTYGCQKCVEDKLSKEFSKENPIIINGDVAYIITSKGEKSIIDSEDVERIKGFCWWVSNTGYLMGDVHKPKKHISIHRLIMNILDRPDIIIDHKNGNKLDNRKSNLRICTRTENSYNKAMQPYNTSGITGVTWDKARRKWAAAICYEGKRIHLGRYSNKDDAIKARREAEDKYFGEFSYHNSRNNT